MRHYVLSASMSSDLLEFLCVSFDFFFFQAEDGIRDTSVTGVQTCALPIFSKKWRKIHEDFAPLLRKAGRLTPEERMLMQAHPVRSADLAGTIAEFRGRVQTDIRNHHENYDGTGYPDGLVGEGIPIGARIIMIADTIDAMTTDRPYRKALSLSRALEEMVRYAGRQFDPKLVELVSKSPSIRRLLGPKLVTETAQIPSMNTPSRLRPGTRAAN